MNAAIAREEEKALSRLRSLYEIAKAFNSSLDLKETYGEVLGILSRTYGDEAGRFPGDQRGNQRVGDGRGTRAFRPRK